MEPQQILEAARDMDDMVRYMPRWTGAIAPVDRARNTPERCKYFYRAHAAEEDTELEGRPFDPLTNKWRPDPRDAKRLPATQFEIPPGFMMREVDWVVYRSAFQAWAGKERHNYVFYISTISRKVKTIHLRFWS